MDKAKIKKLVIAKLIKATGEMSKQDLEKGGEWHESRLTLEDIAKPTGKFVAVKPFDVYQGPYALLDNGDKIWFSEHPSIFFVEQNDGETIEMSASDIKKYYKALKHKKPSVKLK